MSPWIEFERAHYDPLVSLTSEEATEVSLAVVEHVLPAFEADVVAAVGAADLAMVKGVLGKVRERHVQGADWGRCMDEAHSIFPGDDSGKFDPGGWGLLISGVVHLVSCASGKDPSTAVRVALERCYSAVRGRALAQAMKTLGPLDYVAAVKVELESPHCRDTRTFIHEALAKSLANGGRMAAMGKRQVRRQWHKCPGTTKEEMETQIECRLTHWNRLLQPSNLATS